MRLSAYNSKRHFRSTSEPRGKEKRSSGKLVFVVQQHAASHLHYDFRLEMDGVLKSWAVPKGPSMNPGDKRLAMMVEDHPYDYKDFEGTIPEGNYGAGNVIVWDNGNYHAADAEAGDPGEKLLLQGLKKGHISFVLEGKKLKGEFSLVKMHGRQENAWLLVKKNDKFASDENILEKNRSVISRQSLEGLTKKNPSKTASRTLSLAIVKTAAAEKTKSPRKAAAKKSAGHGVKKKSPGKIKPMLAEIAPEPFNDPEWIFEKKFDGYRALATITGGKVELYSRNLHSFNEDYPSVVEELKKIRHDCILDGEVVAENRKGLSEFQLLQNSANGKGRLRYYVFDLLFLNGHDLREVPLIERKHLLELLLGEYDFENIIYSEHVAAKGIPFYRKAVKKKLEGIMAKKSASPYRSDRRSREWLKIKITEQQEMIIVGFTAPQGAREHFGSLVLAYYDDNGKLVYGGNCGTGFTAAVLAMLHTKAKPYFTNEAPFSDKVSFREVQWIKPVLVCEVKFTEWTREGNLRHPVYLGLRKDKSAKEVKREKADIAAPKPASMKKAGSKAPAEKKKTARTAKKKETGRQDDEDPGSSDFDRTIGKTVLHLTNQDKIYWPEEKYTKGDLIAYYDAVADYMLPYLKDRPESMHRFPNGIHAPSFYQKDVDVAKIPSWLKTQEIYSASTGEMTDYLVCNDKATLIYMANLGCIEINPWNSRIQKPENPDWAVIDLDPEDISFAAVVKAALAVRETLEELGVESCIKTSGATGMHIFIPLGAKYEYEVVRNFAQLIAGLAHEKEPEITSLERSPSKRKKKVYLDYLQNSKGQTLAAPYSVRPRPGATVSAPLQWKEINTKLDPAAFTIRTMLKRLDKMGDLWKPVLGKGQDILKVVKKIESRE